MPKDKTSGKRKKNRTTVLCKKPTKQSIVQQSNVHLKDEVKQQHRKKRIHNVETIKEYQALNERISGELRSKMNASRKTKFVLAPASFDMKNNVVQIEKPINPLDTWINPLLENSDEKLSNSTPRNKMIAPSKQIRQNYKNPFALLEEENSEDEIQVDEKTVQVPSFIKPASFVFATGK